MMRLPNAASMVVVIDTTLPRASTIEKWLVPRFGVARRRERHGACSPISFARFSR